MDNAAARAGDPGTTLSIREAARRLGVSERTVRRRIHTGELPAQAVDGPYGRQYRIPGGAVEGVRQTLAVVRLPTPAAPEEPPAAFAAAVERAAQAAVAPLVVEIAALRAEIAVLVRALPPPGVATTAPESDENGHEQADEATTPRRRWWRFWRRMG